MYSASPSEVSWRHSTRFLLRTCYFRINPGSTQCFILYRALSVSTFDVKLLHRRGLGRRIIELLSDMHPLPSEGIIAGQSVASAIDEILGLAPPVYNDIDLFLTQAQWTDQTLEPEPRLSLAQSKHRLTDRVVYVEPTPSQDPAYARTFVMANRYLYTVVKARTDGLCNRVLVVWYHLGNQRAREAERSAQRCRDLILGFDLNSTQVAVDLATGKLFFTPAFEHYFAVRQLAIISTFTPLQSYLRYVKKRRELDCYGHDEGTAELIHRLILANEGTPLMRDARRQLFLDKRTAWTPEAIKASDASLATGRRIGTGRHGAPLVFGKKYGRFLETCSAETSPFWEFSKHPTKDLWLTTTKDNAPKLKELHRELNTDNILAPRRFWSMYLPASKLIQTRRALFDQFIAHLEKSAFPDVARHYRGNLGVHGDDYLEGIETSHGLTELLLANIGHAEVREGGLSFLSFGNQIAVLRLVKTMLKQNDLADNWGVLAHRSPSWLAGLLTNTLPLSAAIARMRGSDAPMVEPLPLPSECLGAAVRELRSVNELRAEGNRMRHCVGGYGDAVESGRSRILSLSLGPKATDCSTVEWRFAEDPKGTPFAKTKNRTFRPLQANLAQNYSFGNRAPSAKLYEVEAALRKELNAWLKENPREGWQLLNPGVVPELPALPDSKAA